MIRIASLLIGNRGPDFFVLALERSCPARGGKVKGKESQSENFFQTCRNYHGQLGEKK
jgi:hypothetical protein